MKLIPLTQVMKQAKPDVDVAHSTWLDWCHRKAFPGVMKAGSRYFLDSDHVADAIEWARRYTASSEFRAHQDAARALTRHPRRSGNVELGRQQALDIIAALNIGEELKQVVAALRDISLELRAINTAWK